MPIWTTLLACSLMRTTEETAITSFSYDHEIRETSKKTRLVHRRYLHVVLYHTNSNMYFKYMVVVVGGRASLSPPPTMQMSINFSRLWGAMSWLVFNKWLSNLAVFKFKDALSSGVDGFSFTCLCQELKKTIERSIAWRIVPEIWNNEGTNLTNVLHLIVPFLKYCNPL